MLFTQVHLPSCAHEATDKLANFLWSVGPSKEYLNDSLNFPEIDENNFQANWTWKHVPIISRNLSWHPKNPVVFRWLSPTSTTLKDIQISSRSWEDFLMRFTGDMIARHDTVMPFQKRRANWAWSKTDSPKTIPWLNLCSERIVVHLASNNCDTSQFLWKWFLLGTLWRILFCLPRKISMLRETLLPKR